MMSGISYQKIDDIKTFYIQCMLCISIHFIWKSSFVFRKSNNYYFIQPFQLFSTCNIVSRVIQRAFQLLTICNILSWVIQRAFQLFSTCNLVSRVNQRAFQLAIKGYLNGIFTYFNLQFSFQNYIRVPLSISKSKNSQK